MAEGIIRAHMRFLTLRREAEERHLMESPPYGDPRERRVWIAGYEAALDDIADGKIRSVAFREEQGA